MDLSWVVKKSGALTVKQNGTQSFDMDKFLDYMIVNELNDELNEYMRRLGITLDTATNLPV